MRCEKLRKNLKDVDKVRALEILCVRACGAGRVKLTRFFFAACAHAEHMIRLNLICGSTLCVCL